MSTQRHVIKRQTVEITLAKKTQAWELQQALSRIFQQHIPALLDRCLSEASSPDCLHRIDYLELDLGELDSNRLEAELLERIEATLRQALSEEIAHGQFLPAAQQQSNPVPAHLELFEHFVREGYLPWWADSSQRQLPEKTFAALLNIDPNVLKGSLARLIQEPRSLQRLISYFDDSRLVAIVALLTAAPEDLATSLHQTLSAVQAPLHQLSRMPISRSRATLWESLLQVARADDPVISRHADFLTTVTARWAKLQGLSHQALIDCLQQLESSQTVVNNVWLQAVRLSMSKKPASATFVEKAVEQSRVTLSKSEPVSESSTAEQSAGAVSRPKIYRYQLAPAVISNRYAMLNKRRFVQSEPDNELLNADETIDAGLANTSMDYGISPSLLLEERRVEGLQKSSNHEHPQYRSSTDYRRRFVSAAARTGQTMLNKQISPQTELENESLSASRTTDQTNSSIASHRWPALTAISSRYAMLKSIAGAHSERAQKSTSEPLAGDIATKRPAHKLDDALSLSAAKDNILDTGTDCGFSHPLPLECLQGCRSVEQCRSNCRESWGEGFQKSATPVHQQYSSPEGQANIDTANNRPAFSDADAVYINNAGLCILWPFLGSFFERLELVQDGRFHNQAAKQRAASLLHYLTTEELNPPEYLLPFNKLLCAMAIDDVFDLAAPLTAAQTEACDELLGAVIGNAPILNNMSINGFRGSFLLRQGSLSASEGSWLLRVERETYDLVLERFPWSWQWFKLPWMEYPIRVEW
ncbi:MAG TPA: contractile injection system tape measure protein [Methylobacter sp.]|jgi:hypothetical protein